MRDVTLGVEFGSTRIKAQAIDDNFIPVSSGGFTWKSTYENGIWTYSLDDVRKGFIEALSGLDRDLNIKSLGISAMMHGYLAFDKNWNLLVPFRTWQNTITAEAAACLTKEFDFNIPQRWSIAHLYRAILNDESHVKDIAHITTLSGYVNYMLTGKFTLSVGDASGMFPIDPETCDFDEEMLNKFDELIKDRNYPWKIRDILPKVLTAGEIAGYVTEKGSEFAGGLIPAGVKTAPPEGDAGTGMAATNSVAPRTGNISAGTSIFAMVVLEKPLSKVYEEIDIVTTPSGKPVAMVHCNNCTNDTNAWESIFKEVAALTGKEMTDDEIFPMLYKKTLEGSPDCGGVVVVNYMAGEGVTHFDEGRPMVIRLPGCDFTLANFFRAQLYSTMTTLKIGLRILENENVKIDSLTGHGGLFRHKGIGQRYLAAACNTKVTCMSSAGEGGPYGMALLAKYMDYTDMTLEDFLEKKVFSSAEKTFESPRKEDVEGFNAYLERFEKALDAEKAAINQ